MGKRERKEEEGLTFPSLPSPLCAVIESQGGKRRMRKTEDGTRGFDTKKSSISILDLKNLFALSLPETSFIAVVALLSLIRKQLI